jgi:hypothetical protein
MNPNESWKALFVPLVDTRLPIGEPLPLGSVKNPDGSVFIINSERNAVAVAEVKLRQIAVQMLLRAVLIDAPSCRA